MSLLACFGLPVRRLTPVSLSYVCQSRLCGALVIVHATPCVPDFLLQYAREFFGPSAYWTFLGLVRTFALMSLLPLLWHLHGRVSKARLDGNGYALFVAQSTVVTFAVAKMCMDRSVANATYFFHHAVLAYFAFVGESESVWHQRVMFVSMCFSVCIYHLALFVFW